jgi:hypothetical protein
VLIPISPSLQVKPTNYSLFAGFVHLGAGLACGFTGLSAGYAVGFVGDSVRLGSLQRSLFIDITAVVCTGLCTGNKSLRLDGSHPHLCGGSWSIRVRFYHAVYLVALK